MRYAMTIDTRKCVACGACVIACQTEYNIPTGYSRSWLTEKVWGNFPNTTLELRSERCQHCEHPPCVSNCPTDASYIGRGGVVLVKDEICIGCGACIESCPYDARYFAKDGSIDKCTFCEGRVEKGHDPACVDSCPTTCMTFGDIEDPNSEISKLIKSRKWKQLKKNAGTDPRIFYLT